jgi:hypothetical protein
LVPSSSAWGARPVYPSVSPRASIQRARNGARPWRTSMVAAGSVYGPEVSYSAIVSPLVNVTSRIGTRSSPCTLPCA